MKVAIVVGRAKSMGVELVKAVRLATDLGPPPILIAVNVAGTILPSFQHWVSYHPSSFALWREERRLNGEPDFTGEYWSGVHRNVELGRAIGDPTIRHLAVNGGSSGYLGVRVALDAVQADRVILAGIPLDNSPRFDDSEPWKEYLVYREIWRQSVAGWEDRVRSYSGFTWDLLGEPTREWLKEGGRQSGGTGIDIE